MALYNLKNPAVKRLMKEAEELKDSTEEYYAHPLEDNLFEWHFTIRGPPKSEFEGGIYHGRITLPPEYPMKPPSIILLTPNGRFETNKKICLSISGHHPESWQPSWSIRTALLAIIGFLPTHGNGNIGSLDYTPEERKALALKSQNWKCRECGLIRHFLKSPKSSDVPNKENVEVTHEKKFDVKETSSIQRLEPDNTPKTNNQIESGAKESESTSSLHLSESENESGHSSVSRHRKVSFQGKQHREGATSDVKTVGSVKEYNINYCSLFVMWVIVILLVVLIARRLLY